MLNTKTPTKKEQSENEEKESGVVLEVLQKGYMYKDRVLRIAMVKVNE